MTRDQIRDDGIEWVGGKRQAGQAVKRGLIEWSPQLRATIDEALAIKRNKLAGSWFLFGNLSGQRYTKGGWKKTLSVLMNACVVEAAKDQIEFRTVQRAGLPSDGRERQAGARGDADTVDATLHSNDRMVRTVYDRRRRRVAKPAG